PGEFEDWWVQTLRFGGFFQRVAATGAPLVAAPIPTATHAIAGQGALTMMVFPHPFLYDGRHANKPWAQEVPEPVTSWSWTSWAEIHPDTAKKLGLTDKDRVNVSANGTKIEVDWFPSRGIQPDVVAVVLGNGKQRGGRYTRYGANPMKLLATSVDDGGAMRFVTTKASLARSGGTPQSIPALGSMDQQGRHINYVVSAEDLGSGDGPGSIVPAEEPELDERLVKAGIRDMFPEPDHPTYRFAMAVDLNRCTGCGACMTACHAENNIPVVGPDQLRRSRYMGWIRLDRFWEGRGEYPDVRFQPVMCQQCSHAPCEGVCPVLATYHNLDGLNAMIYNRCVGTRYCANNCPYSARRFNFHSYRWPESFNLMLNPDVSTRDMGVMEKCTFCVQRIRDIKDHYRDQGFTTKVPHQALDELTACAKACPSDALVFGNAKQPESAVSKQFADPRAFTMLGELNDKPGVRYLARINHIPSLAHHDEHNGHTTDTEGSLK
ncbi:MAG: 4Fe-4S dicluster domain-containing protein, partial [Oligoflexia bacterium]|nr:4Fe-4S dicluster domain-containing protein [Oligoflexia bacterium]